MRRLVVSTCGTSLLTYDAPPDLRRAINETANHQEHALTFEQKDLIDQRIHSQAEPLERAALNVVRQRSAELNGILGLYENQPARGTQDQHVLLHTDTYQGERSAVIVRNWLAARGLSASIHKAIDLTTADLDSFRAAMNSLVTWCDETLPGCRKGGFWIAFNLVAGFKSWQGFMQTLGMFYADEILYIFEGSDQLLRIPRLPVQFESAAVEAIRRHLNIFRRLDSSRATLSAVDCAGVPDTFFYQLGELVELSPWGRLVWQRHKREIYGEGPLAPLSELVILSEHARKQVQQLERERLEEFNQRMDDLSRYLESDQKLATRRLDFKQLKGDPMPPSTHECDLWADKGAWRAFGHFEAARFVVDKIGSGLH